MIQGSRSIAAVAVLLSVLVIESSAVAEEIPPGPSSTDVNRAMHTYFAGEKRGGVVLIGMGVAGLATGGVLFGHSSAVAEGFSYPLLAVGTAHLAAGIFVYVASHRRQGKFRAQIDKNAGAFSAREHKRMRGVQKQFTALKIVELVLIAGGGALAVVGARTDRDRLLGVGLGLSLEAALTLAFDVVAARRAGRYVTRLSRFRVALQPSPTGDAPSIALLRGGRF